VLRLRQLREFAAATGMSPELRHLVVHAGACCEVNANGATRRDDLLRSPCRLRLDGLVRSLLASLATGHGP
jgi:hypothetical protein